ncbi:hypothetical protein PTI98_001614 [Pleurotus ostreatus]|nr:hypothetical protein PTI98_001614 [Pleurotus ostreatus]
MWQIPEVCTRPASHLHRLELLSHTSRLLVLSRTSLSHRLDIRQPAVIAAEKYSMPEEKKNARCSMLAWKGNTTAILGSRSGAQFNNLSVPFSGHTHTGAILEASSITPSFWRLRFHTLKSAAT